jgi:hypothetical protein
LVSRLSDKSIVNLPKKKALTETSTPPLLDERYLTRRQLAEECRKIGVPMSESQLAHLAVVGGGPEMVKYNQRVLYPWRTSRAWLAARLGKPRGSTSETQQTAGVRQETRSADPEQ